MWKNNLLIGLLVAGVALMGLGAVIQSLRYHNSLQQLQRTQRRFAEMQLTLATAQSLANEAVEYSKRNPAIDSILIPLDLKPGVKPPIPPAPASAIPSQKLSR